MSPRRIQFDASRQPLPLLLNTPEFAAAWADWCADRAERGKPLTQRAATISLNDCERMGPEASVAAIRHSIAACWSGIYPAPPIAAPRAAQGQSAPEPQWAIDRRRRDLEAKLRDLKQERTDLLHPGGIGNVAWDDMSRDKQARFTRLNAQIKDTITQLKGLTNAD